MQGFPLTKDNFEIEKDKKVWNSKMKKKWKLFSKQVERS